VDLASNATSPTLGDAQTLGVVGTDDTLDVPGPITVLKRRSYGLCLALTASLPPCVDRDKPSCLVRL
jgi:hypothetical protein